MKKSIEEKRAEYEASLNLSEQKEIKSAPIKKIEFETAMHGKCVFEDIYILENFLRCQNPMGLAQIKKATQDILFIDNMGWNLNFRILGD